MGKLDHTAFEVRLRHEARGLPWPAEVRRDRVTGEPKNVALGLLTCAASGLLFWGAIILMLAS